MGVENRTLVEIQVAAAKARKQEILQSPLPNRIEALESRAQMLTALDQIIISMLAKCPLSAAEEQAERTLTKENQMLVEERRTQETRIRELQQKDPPLIGGTTQSKFVD
jgi:restriction endonuclease Mrr